MIFLCALAAASAIALPHTAEAKDSLGVFESWGAFRDPAVPRCYAISEPVRRGRKAGWKPFASIATWPRQAVRGQLHIRLSQPRRVGSRVTLSIGGRRFALVAGNADAWAPDKQTDAAIVATMRSGTSMSVETVSANGRAFADVYALRGAATAIDAAALGCSRL
ncbi:MAG: hypothetical protein QHC67_02760 [Sphingobium sp.]|uniref:invasion associated locus B family protein n=1 Tax=Sphingobium sp. TaxID=1912891 RepID=UPI0029A24EBE|nr:invasion associated locus B family protein [Sphingobium sp.]MDX3908720.1 hypothetical protein [Sphingobium sp.]